MKRILLVSTCLITLGSASIDAATTNLIIELVPFAVADGARESLNIYGQVSEGTTSYCQLSGGGYGVQITRVDGLGGPLVETQLVAPSNWLAVSGKTFLTGYYGFDVWGDYLQFCGATLRQIWRVNKHTGAIAVHISQEAITNAARHAGATEIGVLLEFETRQLRLSVTDDGCGFDPAQPPVSEGGFGIVSMRERAAELHAALQVVSKPGQGTVVSLCLPLVADPTTVNPA